jgi:Kelch motif
VDPHICLAAVAVDNRIYVIGGGPKPGGTGNNLNEIFYVREVVVR